MTVQDIPVESLYIAAGVCSGIILVLVAILLFFCCAPRRVGKRQDFEAAAPHRRAQPIGVSSTTVNIHESPSSSKPFARVAPTLIQQTGIDNYAADLSDSLRDTRALCSADPLGAITLPPQYVEVTADNLHVKDATCGDPPPTYASLSRRWQSTGQLNQPLQPQPLSVTNLQPMPIRTGSRSAQDLTDIIDSDPYREGLYHPRRPKRVVYEVVV